MLFKAKTKTTDQGESQSRPESKLANKIIFLLKKAEFGKAQIALKLGHKTVSGELKKQISQLLENSIIEMTIPERPNSRLQQYRLTEKGKVLLKDEQ